MCSTACSPARDPYPLRRLSDALKFKEEFESGQKAMAAISGSAPTPEKPAATPDAEVWVGMGAAAFPRPAR